MAGLLSSAREVLSAGWFEQIDNLRPLGEGHINQTLLVTRSDESRFVLQRINEQVFTNPALVMSNLSRVQALIGQQAPGLIPRLVATRQGAPAWYSPADGCWRLWEYVEGTRSLSRTTDPTVARAAGLAFGRFQRLLALLGDPPLVPTIPGFLELAGYLDALDAALKVNKDATEAALNSACGGLQFIDQHSSLSDRFPPADQYIHGDCKLNNLLFDDSESTVVAVLDLDTVMRGHWAWDFGDLSRSLLVSGVSQTLFREVVAGFTAGNGWRGDPLVLVEAPVYVAFMLGVRFLTDHLEGDNYFKVNARGDNLIRAGEQFRLVQGLEAERENLLTAAIEGLARAEHLSETGAETGE